MLRNGVVVHFQSGKILKGTTTDFSPRRSKFHVFPTTGGPGTAIQRSELKAVFFVKTIDGDPFRSDPKGFLAGPAENTHGTKIAVRFADGELVCGYTLGYSPQRDGFFMVPSDARGNNLRIFVVHGPGIEVGQGADADALVQRVLDSRAA